MIKQFLVLALFAMPFLAQAQVIPPETDQSTEFRKSIFGLGISGGPATGLGISFRHHLPSPFSYQVIGGIVNVSGRLLYDIGGDIQYDVIRSSAGRFFIAGGAAYFYAARHGENNVMEAPGRLGVGLGGEFAKIPGVHSQVELMFTYFSDGTILPLPQLGLHYYFN